MYSNIFKGGNNGSSIHSRFPVAEKVYPILWKKIESMPYTNSILDDDDINDRGNILPQNQSQHHPIDRRHESAYRRHAQAESSTYDDRC